jgi:simple sugar transport system ATP-binding protein
MPGEPTLEAIGITKDFPSLRANDNIDFAIKPGEIHALLGENGAGKSTLVKILYGALQPTAGEIRWKGKPVRIANPAAARQLGIGMVFQHFSLFEALTVAENIALALADAPGLADLKKKIAAVSAQYGLPLNPDSMVADLSVGERQRVEIVRCLLQEPKLLIMDEPTSVLTPQAVQKLFETLRKLAAEGCSILYISHKLDEIKALCSGATVLRGGKVTGTCDPRNESTSSMARLMIGKDLPVCEHAEAAAGGEPRLAIAGLSHKSDDPFGTDLEDVHLTVHSGEIVGIAGVSGNGQQELLVAVSGEEPLAEPFPIRLLGAEVGRMHPGRRRKLGLGFVPEERLGRGAVPNMSLAENALLTAHRHGDMVRGGLVRADRTTAYARECIEKFTVKCGGAEAEARSLSGGNLQKFIVGREILQAPKVLVVAQPTWGVDVGAAAFIRQSLIDLRNRGTAILVISEELDELFEICDRIAVIAKGRLSLTRRTRETNVEEIGVWMSGLWPGAKTDDMQPRSAEAPIAAQA